MKKNIKKIIAALFTLSVFTTFAFSEGSQSSFTSADSIKKAQVAMATNEYIVTAGDIYTLAFASGSFSISVDSTYKVRIANLGFINAQGLTLQEFKNRVESLVVSNYPTGGIQFFLANPAQFHVFVKGEVTSSSVVDAWALNHVTDIVGSFYTPYSSNRFIKIISASGKETTYDLYKASRDGDFSQNPYLRPGDTIVVPKYDRKVTVSGEVMRAGTYELLPGEELNSLIFDYGQGFSPYADKNRIELSSFTGGNPLYQVSYLTESDLHLDKPLACYDSVNIASRNMRQGYIYVEGAVSNRYDISTKSLVVDYDDDGNEKASLPGDVASVPSTIALLRFPYTAGKTCSQLIAENPLMLLNSSNLTDAYIWRNGTNRNEGEKIPINLYDLIFKSDKVDTSKDLVLEPEDTIVIPFIQYYVNVQGAVVTPGKYSYQPGKDWTYYVSLAEGLDYDQNLFKVVKIVDKEGKKLSKKSVIPPEATIYASRNSPNNGWFLPLLTAILTFVTTCLTCFAAFKGVF